MEERGREGKGEREGVREEGRVGDNVNTVYVFAQ